MQTASRGCAASGTQAGVGGRGGWSGDVQSEAEPSSASRWPRDAQHGSDGGPTHGTSQLKRAVRRAGDRSVRKARVAAHTRFIQGHVQGLEGKIRQKRDRCGAFQGLGSPGR